MPPPNNNIQSPSAILDGAPTGEVEGSSKKAPLASTTKQLPHLNQDNEGNNPPQVKVKQERRDEEHHAEVKAEVLNEERD